MKWHDTDYQSLFLKIKQTGQLLKTNPRNPCLRGNLITENNKYKRFVKYKQSQLTDKLCSELESMHHSEPVNICNL